MSWLETHPDIQSVYTAIADLNGQARGKRMPRETAAKAESGSARMPFSALNVDVLGNDIDDSPLVFKTGDQDGILKPTERGYVPMPWLDTPSALLPMWMFAEDGTPYAGDPRHALARVLDGYAARGWTPIVATELEYFLLSDAKSPGLGRLELGSEILSVQVLEQHDGFFTDLYAACAAMGIAADAASSEAAAGQYEVNLSHGPAMKAADDTWLFKMATRGIARKHGATATFMAKPMPDQSGNGLHVHFSVLDREGRNIFDNGGPEGTPLLRNAVAGCLGHMQASTLVFAPHANSYERLVPNSHAPTSLSWAYDNRTASVRIPAGPPAARRIEHRVAGGDANPYLLLAAILGAALRGIEANSTPPAPIDGSAYEAACPSLPADWSAAIDLFAASTDIPALLATELIENFVRSKRQDQRTLADIEPKEIAQFYLDRA